MTEPDVASSDATNIATRIERDGDEYVLNGRKWWITGAMNPQLRDLHRHGQDRPRAPPGTGSRAMILVPARHPGPDDRRAACTCSATTTTTTAATPSCLFDDVRVPVDNLIGGEGDGFAIAQARLGPGRIHHCMRSIGVAERAIELMCRAGAERGRVRQAARPSRA